MSGTTPRCSKWRHRVDRSASRKARRTKATAYGVIDFRGWFSRFVRAGSHEAEYPTARQRRRPSSCWNSRAAVERLGDAALVERGAERGDEGIGVLGDEELAVAADAARVVDEGDELGLGAAVADLDVGPEHRVGLLHLVRVGLGEGEAALVRRLCIGFEQLVLLHESAERRACDALRLQKTSLDARAVDRGEVARDAVDSGRT
jgi:hypothetical protein